MVPDDCIGGGRLAPVVVAGKADGHDTQAQCTCDIGTRHIADVGGLRWRHVQGGQCLYEHAGMRFGNTCLIRERGCGEVLQQTVPLQELQENPTWS